MTDSNTLRQRYDEFSDKLMALVNEYKDTVAPDWDSEEGRPCHHGPEDCPCVPKETLMAAEFVVVVNWMDMEINEMVVTGYSAPHMRLSHTIGLVEYYRDRLRG